MRLYLPANRANEFPEINRHVSGKELAPSLRLWSYFGEFDLEQGW